MKIRITFDLNADARQAVANYYGVEGPASRERCKAFLDLVVNAALQDNQEPWMEQDEMQEDA